MGSLNFPLTGPRMRKESFAKVDLLAEIVNRLRDSVHDEADLITNNPIGEFMPEYDSENGASTNDPKLEYKYPPCPGCGAPLEKDAGRYVCDNCDYEWEAWEVLDSMF